MPISRRALAQCLATGALAASASDGAFSRLASAREGGALVIVRSDGRFVAVDPRTGDIARWNGALPASPVPIAEASPIPGIVAMPVTEGAVGYWMASADGDAFIFRVDTGASSAWWWRRDGERPVALGLPGDLEPAFPSGASARWFHGATVDAAHLGSGTLRLLAIDFETGETVLDHELDRRLELAATKVSPDGAIVAHVQSATAGIAFWAADLRGGARLVEAGIAEEPGMAAASAIEMDVAAGGEAVVVAAGLVHDWPGAPGSTVYALWSAPPDTARTLTLPGELVGIVPAGTTRP